MKPPRIIQFMYSRSVLVKTGPWWNRETKVKEVFDVQAAYEERGFTSMFEEKMVVHFTHHPPCVGDLVFVEGCFRIVKVFFNFHQDRYTIWWVADLCAESRSVTLDKPL